MKDCFGDVSSKGIFWETHALLQKKGGSTFPYDYPDASDVRGI